ncbi:DUF427 domain-containing protein [Microbacterium kribbense]|uniref:DUF427 domain-containing protein n=1 Tax=Microbacterium kribbense TaxID=433645 RepID=A0ABP7GIS4_9MICO
MKARLGDITVAAADQADLIRIEGNWYFPPESVDFSLLEPSDTPYTCPWKGECQYYSIRAGDQVRKDLAWAYPHPYPDSFDKVGRNYSGYVAFSKEVEVAD